MAPNAHYRYSAAVEYAQSQWESVNKRFHYTMKEDGFVVLFDPNHQMATNVYIQKIDPARLCPFEVRPTSAQHGAQITVNKLGKTRLSPFEPSSSDVSAARSSVPIRTKLDPSLVSLFEQPKVDPLKNVATPLISNVNQFDHQVTILINDTNEIVVSAPGSSSNVSAAHSSVPISKKSDPSLVSLFEKPKVESFHKVASPLISNVNDFNHQVLTMVNDIKEIVVSAPGSNIKLLIPSNVNDELDHHNRSSSIGSTGGKRHSIAYTISNAENHKEKAPITADTHLGSDNITKDKPNITPFKKPIPNKHHGTKGPSIGDKNAMPRFMTDTVSSASKRRTKVSIPARSGFNHYTKNGPGFPCKIPIPTNHLKNRQTSFFNNERSLLDDYTKSKPNCLQISPVGCYQKPAYVESLQGDETEKDVNAHEIAHESRMNNRQDICVHYSDIKAKYNVTEQVLGSGESSSARVVKGIRKSDGLVVAIKTIKKSMLADDASWGLVNPTDCNSRFPLEYCLLRMVTHGKGVIKLFDAFDSREEFIMVLELLEPSYSLEDWIEQKLGPIDESEAKSIFYHLINAVIECQKNGVYHRDLKEANIILDFTLPLKPMPKLIDFGIAALVADSPYYDNPGSDAYMAPEMWDEDGKAYDGAPAAVYSLGVVLKNMVNGYYGDKPAISDQCKDLIEKMLLDCPNGRPSLAEILVDPWMH
jgi:hypothetical protein